MKNFYNKGITMLEIIIAISIIIILSVIIIPSLSDFKDTQSLKNTTENVVALLNKAKSDSNSSLNSSKYSVYFESDKAVYFKGETYSSSDETNEIISFEKNIIIADDGLDLEDDKNTITFPRLTDDVSGYGTIKLQVSSDSDKYIIINVNKLGAISIE